MVTKPERKYRPGADWSLVPSPRPPLRTVVWTPDMIMVKEPRPGEQQPEDKPQREQKPRRKVKFEDGPAKPVKHMYYNNKTGEVLETYTDLRNNPEWSML